MAFYAFQIAFERSVLIILRMRWFDCISKIFLSCSFWFIFIYVGLIVDINVRFSFSRL